jgi:thioester reductase-like protein
MTTTLAAGPRTFLVTGYPGLLARRLAERIAREEPKASLVLQAQPKFDGPAQAFAKQLGQRAEVMLGDVADMHLGLAADEYLALRRRVTDIFHLAAISYLGVARTIARKVNVEGTRNLLELAEGCGALRRFNHLSTAFVSGDRVGVIMEDELDAGQGFHSAFEETKAQAERLVRKARARVKATVYRPSAVVGDSKTGEIDRFDGPYALALLLAGSPRGLPLPLPGNGVAPLNVVPIDFVLDALWKLSEDPRAEGMTFHLVDPHPMSARRVYELVAEKTQRRMPRFTLSARATDWVLRLPLLERLARPQRAAIAHVNRLALYNCRNTLALLEGTGIECPPLLTYLDTLISFAQKQLRLRAQAPPSFEEDPLDLPVNTGATQRPERRAG